ncbi:DUF2726 domain-containing protein [Deinococcus radiophilus]|uniref:DUF2726 domain-containing protein n=1 Tax=Deinococcus radiophilus TaxID=32062 RepID=UPI001E2F7ABD|nr:DUF2726 domain-containing protein [Deinococcus radiophilus]UFA51290.1 DUF2726 domain-containing protein [Deinococcus radiophilus]
MTPLVVGLLVGAVILLTILVRANSAGSVHQPAGKSSPVPDHLPVQAKRYFFARSERAFYERLLRVLPDGYVIFPNVRLNDLFLIKANGAERQATYARLRDKHIDFLIVRLPDYQPVLAIELDGATHNSERQQRRDAVKDAVFASGRLPLLRIDAAKAPSEAELSGLLATHLAPATAPAGSAGR